MSARPNSAFAELAGTRNWRFALRTYLSGTVANRWLRDHANVWRPGDRVVLSVADGEGRNSVWLAQHGLAVDAFDISELAVQKARRLAAARGARVNFAVMDCNATSWPEALYDGVAAIFVQFAEPAARRPLFANMVKTLKPGGTLLLQGYTPKQLQYGTGGPPRRSHLHRASLLRAAFAGMRIRELCAYEERIAEGSGYRGRSALVEMVAQRP